MKLKKIKYINKFTKLVIVFILIFITIILIIKYVNRQVSPVFIEYASIEAKKLSNIIINDAVDKYISGNIDVANLFTIVKDDNGEIRTIDFNNGLVNKYLTKTTKSIQKNITYIENGSIDNIEYLADLTDYNKEDLKQGIIYKITSGALTGSPLLANIGPKIPIKISLVGQVSTNIDTKITNYGINNALIEVNINVKIKEKTMLPFFKQDINIETTIPLASKIITGTVPKYYANGINQSTPNITVNEE